MSGSACQENASALFEVLEVLVKRNIVPFSGRSHPCSVCEIARRCSAAIPPLQHIKLSFRAVQIWDVLENEEVVQLVASHAPRKDAAIKVVQSAVRAWREKYPHSKTDDCACVVLFFDGVDKESPNLEAAVAQAKITKSEAENPGRSLRSLADLGLLTKPPDVVDESLMVRADSVVDLSAVSRAMDSEVPGDDDDGSALIARADSVTTIVRKL
jgi:hypothetical protein